jgi:hypothetical protein
MCRGDITTSKPQFAAVTTRAKKEKRQHSVFDVAMAEFVDADGLGIYDGDRHYYVNRRF